MPRTFRTDSRSDDGTGESGTGENDARESDGPSRSDEIPEYVIEDLLASDRRRRMLEILARRSNPVVLDDLVRATLAEERGTVPSEIPREACRAARTEAYETHLPKLTAVDAVHYDSLVGTVELTAEAIVERIADDA